MAEDNLAYAACVPMISFDPSTLTGSFQVLNGNGFDDSVKIWKLYNGSSTVSIDLSLDGITPHDFIPPLGTCIVDFQTNHSSETTYGTGTLNLRRGQLIWGRTAVNPTFLKIIGFR